MCTKYRSRTHSGQFGMHMHMHMHIQARCRVEAPLKDLQELLVNFLLIGEALLNLRYIGVRVVELGRGFLRCLHKRHCHDLLRLD
jgi:hypothetical protein